MTRILVLAGHDPTGGAGVSADEDAAWRFRVEAKCIVTAWTDQDGEAVQSVGARVVKDWLAEAREALTEEPDAIKTGLLPGAEHVRAAAKLAKWARGRGVPVVVDPVLRASGGETFLDDEGIEALLGELISQEVVLTPNLYEAARLTDLAFEDLAADPEARIEAARRLTARGARAVVVKAGHGLEDPARDLVFEAGEEPEITWLEHARQHGRTLHGSGCRMASAIAALLARGEDLAAASRGAQSFVAELLVCTGQHE